MGGDDRIKISYSVVKEVNGIKKVDEVILINVYKGEVDIISVVFVLVRDIVFIVFIDGKSVFFLISNVKIYVVGGSILMSISLVNKINVKRFGGLDRYDINKKVIKEFYLDVLEFYLSDGYDLVNVFIGFIIVKENLIVLVLESSDKFILVGVDKIIRLGLISDSVYNKCVFVV